MQKIVLLALLTSMVSGISASENLVSQSNCQGISTSCISAVISSAKTKVLGYVALAALGVYGLYRLGKHAMYQEEERMFQEHASEPESYAVTRNDFKIVSALIDAMEQDTADFGEEPTRVMSLKIEGFDNEEMASGCEKLRADFCMLYEQCVKEPENKQILDEIVMIFKQAVEETMVIA